MSEIVSPVLNHIQLMQLRQALIVAEEGSFIRAGRRLNTHYSLVSRKIRYLEESVGMKLFTRGGNGVTPTPEGADFLRDVRQIITDLESVLNLAESGRHKTTGSLSVGFYVSMLDGELCNSVHHFVTEYPDISLQYLEAPRAELRTALNNRAIDVKVSALQTSAGNSTLPLWSERILVALRFDHPLALKTEINWRDLAVEPIILRRHEPGNELRDLLLTKINDRSALRIVHQNVERDSLLGLVRRGNGLALVYETDAGIRHREIVYREIEDGHRPAQVRYYAHWRSENKNPALASFLSVLRKRYGSMTCNKHQ
ncbi:LysR family transcriptional regulator [Rhizobium puerariae]|uniref:LysR family transcriptional regulator n=1 Tax=Rhizobium puerariae TaxID=1585791 RepID=A0ABV6AE75_9HYPH